MDIDTKEKKQIITKFGAINFKGLEQLEDKYDAYQTSDSINKVSDVIGRLRGLLVDMERLRAGAIELFDGDSSYTEKFLVEECGDIGTFAMDICDELSNCSDEIDKAYKQLAPLQRLMSTEEDDEVYIDCYDSLDIDEEDHDELDDYEDDDEEENSDD